MAFSIYIYISLSYATLYIHSVAPPLEFAVVSLLVKEKHSFQQTRSLGSEAMGREGRGNEAVHIIAFTSLEPHGNSFQHTSLIILHFQQVIAAAHFQTHSACS